MSVSNVTMNIKTKHTDWLGQEYDVGDYVLYPAQSGRSSTMVIAEVTGFTAKGVQVRPLHTSRWGNNYGNDYYVDVRSDQRIDPFRDTGHIKVDSHYVDTRNGQRIADINLREYFIRNGGTSYVDNPNYVPREFQKHIPREFQPWVKKCHENTKLVTITVTKNITRWDGELPDDIDQ